MLKYFILVINSLLLFIYNIFLSDPVKVQLKFPESAKPGSDFVAEVNINKGATSGFAKLQINLPDGFTAKEIESKGGTFTFENHMVKYIWTSLPAENEMKLKFNVAVASTVAGSRQITGKFAYIVNNIKQQLDIDSLSIKIEAAPSSTPVASAPATNTATPAKMDSAKLAPAIAVADKTKDSVVAKVNTADDSLAKKLNAVPVPATGIACVRKIVPGTTVGSYKVMLTIRKLDLKGFAKLLETIPANAKASAQKTGGASFSQLDNAVKFVWVSLPKEEELTLEYQLVYTQALGSTQKISGEFSYLENDQSKKLKVSGQEFFSAEAEQQALAAVTEAKTSTAPVEQKASETPAVNTTTNTPVSPVNNSIAATTPTTTEPAKKEETSPVATTQVATETTTNTENKTQAAAPETKTPESTVVADANKTQTPATENNFTGAGMKKGQVNYGVQIGAYKKSYKADYYVKKYGITEKIRTDMHEGYTKCIIGSFDEYKDARDHREGIRNKGLSGAFVTAYNSGKRITVQEALMISNQKWYR